MNMAVDEPAFTREGHKRVVVHDDGTVPVDDHEFVVDAFKESFEVEVPHPRPVMVANDEVFVPGELVKIVRDRSLAAKREIADNIDVIIAVDACVPVVDECMVHLLDRVEGPIAKLDDVGMAQVKVACVVVRYPFTPNGIPSR